MGSLDGKVAIVTGAGQGVGREHALLLAAEGAAVIVNDLGDGAHATVADIEAAGGRAEAHLANVGDWATGDALVEHARDAYGDLHIVVNNAGVLRDAMSFSMTEADWDLVINVHLKGHFVTTRAAAAWWRAQAKEGIETPRRIINTSSESALFGGPGQSNYAAAKGGILSMTLTLGRELGRYHVTANVLAPRARTPMTQGTASMAAPDDPDAFDSFEPANVSPFLVWLCTDAAQGVSGQTFIVGSDGVWWMRRYSHIRNIRNGGKRWTVAELDERVAELFAGESTEVPPFEAPPFRL